MKVFLTVALLNVSLIVVCQDLAFIRKSLELIDSPKKFQPDSTGLSKLPQLNYSCLQNLMNDEAEVQNCLQVTDLDDDKQLDILFSGPCNPYFQVGIFLNRGTYFQEVFDRGGEIVEVNRNKEFSKIYVRYQGCCGDINNEIIEITIQDNSMSSMKTLQYLDSTTPTTKRELRELNIAGILRKTPEINDVPFKDSESSQEFIGNQIMEWSKPKIAIQLQTKGDWSLVVVEKEKNISVLGWIMRRKREDR